MAPPEPAKQWKPYDQQECDFCGDPKHEVDDCPDEKKHEKPTCKACGHWGHTKKLCRLDEKRDLDFFTPKRRKAIIEAANAPVTKQQPTSDSRPKTSSGVASGSKTTSSDHPKEKKAKKEPTLVQKRAISLRKDVAEALKNAKANEGYFEFSPEPISSKPTKNDPEVLANYFEVKISEKIDLFKYRIAIGEMYGDVPKKKETIKAMVKSLMQKLEEDSSQNLCPPFKWASDFNSILVTTSMIFKHPEVVTDEKDLFIKQVTHERDGKPGQGNESIDSTVTFEGKVDLQALLRYCHSTPGTRSFQQFQSATQVLDILNIISWKNIHENDDIGKAGEKFYPEVGPLVTFNPKDRESPKFNLMFFTIFENVFNGRIGFFTSMRTGEGKVLLNVNTTTSVFYAEVTLKKWLMASEHPFSKDDKKCEELKGVKVQDLLDNQPNVRVVFDVIKASDTTNEILEEVEKNIKDNRRWNSYEDCDFYVNIGGPKHQKWYHAKDLRIKPYQRYSKVLQGDTIMVNAAKRSPSENKHHIRNCALKALGIYDPLSASTLTRTWKDNPKLNGFCITNILTDFVKLNYRIAKVPSILYHDEKGDNVIKAIESTGGWNNKEVKYVVPAVVSYPTLHVVTINNQQLTKEVLHEGLNFLKDSLCENGIMVNNTNIAHITNINTSNRHIVVSAMHGALKNLSDNNPSSDTGIPLILVMLPDKNLNPSQLQLLHSSVKWWGDCQRGIATICVLQSKFENKGNSNHGNRGASRGGGSQRAPQRGGIQGQLDGSMDDNYDGASDRWDHGRSRGGGGNSGCHNCGQTDHWVRDCPSSRNSSANANSNNNPQGRNGQNTGHFNRKANKSNPKLKIMGNLSLKFNFKLKGTNHNINAVWPAKFDNTIIIGADVTHSGRDNPCPSLVGVVASNTSDSFPSHYFASARVQRNHQEYIEDLNGMVEERITFWYKKNGSLPTAILFYRDGVSESQFELVKDLEFSQIRDGFNKAAKKFNLLGSEVKITLLVAVKRHHTRFYPTKQTSENKPNVEAGLFVNSVVTDQNQFSFYLQSHHSRLGTARSTHYFVIRNEMELTAEELSQFTMNLCYTTSKSVMPLSICPPAKYADRLCERLRCYMRPTLEHRGKPPGLHLDSPNKTVEDLIKEYRTDQNIWATPQNGNGREPFERRNPWHENLDDIMFYL